ncbi:PIH1 domain-containing protein Nop17-like isoform X3 [Colletes latitarsis]|uniref:PIH1 domain-containing protein Nop17-like isoform X3 n=1 Tax=Colletes latitarsis TaxID=2605962 RepID=UPI0040364F97
MFNRYLTGRRSSAAIHVVQALRDSSTNEFICKHTTSFRKMDAYETRRKDWEDLEVTKEELKTLTECLKKEEFRKLLVEHVKEVTDPENRKIYEKEITQLEKERGVDVVFVNPEPGYVIKTSVNGDKKCFLNICKSNVIAQPSNQPAFEQGHRSLQWFIPYALLSARDDLDKKNMRCMVFDVVFHPDTIYLSSKNAQFRETVNNTAMDGVENNFKVKLDRKNLRFPNMKYKGLPLPTVIRKPSKEPLKKQLDMEPEIYQKIMADYDKKREQQFKHVNKPKRASPATTYYKETLDTNAETDNKYVTPKFSIKHQSDVELEDFTTSKMAKMNATIPKRLIVTIDLPLLKTANDAFLDVQERYLSLKSEKPAKYLLELPLPYCVDANNGNAKFDPKFKKLVIMLPVIPPVVLVSDNTENSEIDSNHGSSEPVLNTDSLEDSLGNSHLSDTVPKLIEEYETVLTTTKMQNESENLEKCSETIPWTSRINEIDTFMDSNIKYSLPPFTCNIYDSQLAITVNVKNVDPNSIRHRILQNNVGIHVLLSSVGAGFFPQHYSLCLKISEDSVDPDSLSSEPWDNNVVFTVTLKNTENLARYYVGRNDEFMEEKDFPTAASFKNQLKELTIMENTELGKDRTINVLAEDDGVVINISSNRSDSDYEPVHGITKSTQQYEDRQDATTEIRSASESTDDELTSNSTAGKFSKGILKSRRTHDFSRSTSESSTDESGMPTSPIDSHYDSEQDINSETDCSNLKKTVRFNEIVSQQLFRSKSSIVNQRKVTTIPRTTKQFNTKPGIYQKLMSDYDEKRERQLKRVERKSKRASRPTTRHKDTSNTNAETNSKYVTPKFSIKYLSDMELYDFETSETTKINSTIPKKLIITIDLPLLKTATDVFLDVQERYLSLKSEKPAKYLLELPLFYCVHAAGGSSRFDTKYKKLVVTLSVIPPMETPLDTREDSGVDSDHGSPVPVLPEDALENSLSNSHSSDAMPKLGEKCKTVFTTIKIENESESLEECNDSILRTNNVDNIDTFIDSSIKYTLPPFTCNIYLNQLAITVDVKYVNPNSIRHRILQNNLGIHILLMSVNAELIPQHYSLCIKIHNDTVDPDSLTIDPCDNDVLFTVILNNTENLLRYYVGLNEEFMEEKLYPSAASFKDLLKKLTATENTELGNDGTVNEQAEDDGVVINISPNQLDSDDEVGQESTNSTREHAVTKTRSVSENSGDELTSDVSESNTDENGIVTSSIESDSWSLKKTVRFDTMVSIQYFRSNGSIVRLKKRRRHAPRTMSQVVKPILKQNKPSSQEETSEDTVIAVWGRRR